MNFNFEWQEIIAGLLIAGLVVLFAGAIYIGVDECYFNTIPIGTAVVTGKSYTPSITSTGIGTGVTSNGKLGTVFTSSTSSEKWIVLLKVGNDVTPVETDSSKWGSIETGEIVDIFQLATKSSGRIFGMTFSKQKAKL